jgi:hypothetical protein
MEAKWIFSDMSITRPVRHRFLLFFMFRNFKPKLCHNPELCAFRLILGQNFRTPINLQSWKYPFIIIHYFGNYPVNEAIIAPHANRRFTITESNTPRKRKKKSLGTMSPNNSMARAIESAVSSIAADGITTIHIEGDEYGNPSSSSPGKRKRPGQDQSEYVYETVGRGGSSSKYRLVLKLKRCAFLIADYLTTS